MTAGQEEESVWSWTYTNGQWAALLRFPLRDTTVWDRCATYTVRFISLPDLRPARFILLAQNLHMWRWFDVRNTYSRPCPPADACGCLWYPRYHAQIKPALIHHKDSKLQNASQYCTHADSNIQLHISFVLADLSLWNIYCLHAAWATEVFARYTKLGRVSNTGWRELPEPLISVLYCYKQFKEYTRDSRCCLCSRFEHCLYTPTSLMCAGGSHHDPKRVSKSKLLFGTVLHYSKLALHQQWTTRGAPMFCLWPARVFGPQCMLPHLE